MGKHIFVITYGDQATPSTKYRFLQYEEDLKNLGITFECVDQKKLEPCHLDKMAKSDLVINQKCLLNKNFSKKIIASAPRLLFDFDDSIYTRPGRPYAWLTRFRVLSRLKFWLRHVDVVTVANQYLKNYADQYSPYAQVIPMALDLQKWSPQKKEPTDKITIGWSGAPVNLHHLERLEPILASLLEKYPHVNLAVYSGQRPKLSCRYSYTPFKEGTEPAFMQSLDIGLLPLTDEEFSRGKSPIKAIQYLACGVPVIGNVFGATGEILNQENSLAVHSDEEWKQAFQRLLDDPSLRYSLGRNGRKHIEQNHDMFKARNQLLDIILNSEKK